VKKNRKTLLLVGNPNVGKSVFFNAMTGHYALVSNYPGTTVELMHGKALLSQTRHPLHPIHPLHHKHFKKKTAPPHHPCRKKRQRGFLRHHPHLALPLEGFEDIVDSPGMYALCPLTEEERVSQRLLLEGYLPQGPRGGGGPTLTRRGPRGGLKEEPLEEPPHEEVLLHVVDAKNLHRALPLSLQLLELGKPLALALNLYDEALAEGVEIEAHTLSQHLGIPVVPTVATRGEGFEALALALQSTALPPTPFQLHYGEAIENAVAALHPLLLPACGPQTRATALLLLQGDTPLLHHLKKQYPTLASPLQTTLEAVASTLETKTTLLHIASQRYEAASTLAEACYRPKGPRRKTFWESLGHLATHPLTGLPLLLLVLYFGLYQFVGTFGAGFLVNFLEGKLFGEILLPPFQTLLLRLLPGEEGGGAYWLRELFGGEYGLVTLGLTYALAIVLPIVASFFFFFSLLEDSGYFPRLALLADKAFKWVGLNGRAIIPLVLGLGCGTMATLVTRIQETRRERLISIVLLALAVPCSAQYGVISALLIPSSGASSFPLAFSLWLAAVLSLFLLSGTLLSRVLPGKPASFYMEIPPMRMPMLHNVLQKTFARLRWYFWEVLPIFLFASFLIWLGRLTGLFGWLVSALAPLTKAVGLPPQMAEVFLFGFFRRDFGAAGLYAMEKAGALNPSQVLIACIMLTLFLPCIAQFLMVRRERGWWTALSIGGLVAAVSLGAGKLTHSLLEWTGLQL